MTEEQSLLAAVRAAPTDDLPRTVYADWLDDNAGLEDCPQCKGEGRQFTRAAGVRGEWITCQTCSGARRVSNGRAERAEFIRTQCELAIFPKDEPTERASCRLMGYPSIRPKQSHVNLCRYCQWMRDGTFTRKKALIRQEYDLWDSRCKTGGWVNGNGLGPEDGHISIPQNAMSREGVTSVLPILIYRRGFLDEFRGSLQQCAQQLQSLVRRDDAVISLVRVTDRLPYHNGAGWAWFRASRRRPSDMVPAHAVLPDDVFLLLHDWLILTPTGGHISGTRYRAYPPEAAQPALSAAFLRWADLPF